MKNINLIRYIAWSFHRTTGMNFDELFSEACLAYCEAINSFDPKKGKLNNYATTIITNRLKDFIKKEHRYQCGNVPDTAIEITVIHEFLDLLPFYVKSFAELILDNLEDIPDELPPVKARIKIKEMLIQKGYKKVDVEYQIKQLRIALHEI
jgi:RNA polymerase sigma factor (sigma-70 family)